MIAVEHVSKALGGKAVLEDISLTADAGSVYGLAGYNGAGKSTLLKIIAGIYRPEKGRVLLGGLPVFENRKAKAELFMLTEELFFLPQTGLEGMRRFYRGYYPSWNDKTYRKLSAFFHLDAQAKIAGFSKGMQRQAGLILALSCAPAYLLLDEAFDGLDLPKRKTMGKLILRYVRQKNATVLISSHNLDELEEIAGTAGLIKDRRLTQLAPASLETRFMMDEGEDIDSIEDIF